MTRKTILAAFLTLSLASWARAADRDYTIPVDGNNIVPGDANLIALDTVISTGTSVANAVADTGKQWADGPGSLYDILMATGPTTSYVVCMDSITTNNVTVADAGWIRLTPPIIRNTTNATRGLTGPAGSSGAGLAIRFRKGLYCLNVVTSGNSLDWYAPLYHKHK